MRWFVRVRGYFEEPIEVDGQLIDRYFLILTLWGLKNSITHSKVTENAQRVLSRALKRELENPGSLTYVLSQKKARMRSRLMFFPSQEFLVERRKSRLERIIQLVIFDGELEYVQHQFSLILNHRGTEVARVYVERNDVITYIQEWHFHEDDPDRVIERIRDALSPYQRIVWERIEGEMVVCWLEEWSGSAWRGFCHVVFSDSPAFERALQGTCPVDRGYFQADIFRPMALEVIAEDSGLPSDLCEGIREVKVSKSILLEDETILKDCS